MVANNKQHSSAPSSSSSSSSSSGVNNHNNGNHKKQPLTSSEQKLLHFINTKRSEIQQKILQEQRDIAEMKAIAENAKRLQEAKLKEQPSRIDEHLLEQERQRLRQLEEERLEKLRKKEEAARLAAERAIAEAEASKDAATMEAKKKKALRLQQFIDRNYVQPTTQVKPQEGSTTPPLPPPPPSYGASTTPPLEEPAMATTGSTTTAPIIKKRNLGNIGSSSDLATSSSSTAATAIDEVIEPNQVSRGIWDSSKEPRKQGYLLPNFNLNPSTTESNNGCNVIRLKITVPMMSKMWSLNVSPENDFYSTNILFHYNPRIGAKYEVILNDRQGTWGDYTRKRVDNANERISRQNELKIVISEEGFYLFVSPNDGSSGSASKTSGGGFGAGPSSKPPQQQQSSLGRLDSFFPHRRPIQSFQGQNLKLWFTYRDDNGNPHSVIVRKVYWESLPLQCFYQLQTPSMRDIVKGRLADDLPRSVATPMPPRTALLTGMPVLEDLKNLQGIESNLFTVFENVESITLIPGTQYAFVRLKAAELLPDFIEENDELAVCSKDGTQHVIRVRPMLESGVLDVAGTVIESKKRQLEGSTTPTMLPPPEDAAPRAIKRSRYEVEDDDEMDISDQDKPKVNVVEPESTTPDLPPPPPFDELPGIEMDVEEDIEDAFVEAKQEPEVLPVATIQPAQAEEDVYEDLY